MACGPTAVRALSMKFSDREVWLVGNGRMVVMVVRIVPHSSIPYEPKVRKVSGLGLKAADSRLGVAVSPCFSCPSPPRPEDQGSCSLHTEFAIRAENSGIPTMVCTPGHLRHLRVLNPVSTSIGLGTSGPNDVHCDQRFAFRERHFGGFGGRGVV